MIDLSDKRFDPLPKDMLAILIQRAKDGDEYAEQRIIETHLRWVWKRCGDDEDAFQQCFFGLRRAIERYNWKFAFSTYATWWIRNSMQKSKRDRSFGRRFTVRGEFQEPTFMANYPIHTAAGRVDESVEREDWAEYLAGLLQLVKSRTTPAEYDLLLRLYGGETLQRIGDSCGVTREAIRQRIIKIKRRILQS